MSNRVKGSRRDRRWKKLCKKCGGWGWTNTSGVLTACNCKFAVVKWREK